MKNTKLNDVLQSPSLKLKDLIRTISIIRQD